MESSTWKAERTQKEATAQSQDGIKKVEFKDVTTIDESGVSDDELKDPGCDKDRDFTIKRYFQSIPRIKCSSSFRDNRRKELETIKVKILLLGFISVAMNKIRFTLFCKKLEKKIEKVFRTQFHRINKLYSIIDTSHLEKIDKEKFGLVLEKCQLHLSPSDIELIWKDFEAENVPFSNVVRRFLKPDEFDQLREVHFKRKIG